MHLGELARTRAKDDKNEEKQTQIKIKRSRQRNEMWMFASDLK